VFGFAYEQEVNTRLENLKVTWAEALKGMEQSILDRCGEVIHHLRDEIENLRDEKANLEARVDELEKSYAQSSIKRVEEEEPAVQVSPGFRRFSQRKRDFERDHQKDGMTRTGQQIAENDKAIRAAKEKK
jgi:hypothetical protein